MNIAHQFKQVCVFLAQNGLLTFLKQMPVPLMTQVVVIRMARQTIDSSCNDMM